jgi:hypothetical protein
MAFKYLVGVHVGDKRESLVVEAEDALIAGLKAKHQNPTATITYIRRANKRGDVRHPHGVPTKPAQPKAKKG